MPGNLGVEDFKRLVNDLDFERIELSLRRPNIFHALGVERRELSHSNFLAWLLNPSESHGLADLLLGKFLRDVFSSEKSQDRSFLDAVLLDLRKVEVRREWRHIDILLVLPGDVIAIENKVGTGDHSGQLSRYREVVGKAFPNRRRHFVYLTPFGIAPEEEGEDDLYIRYSYGELTALLERILSVHGVNLPAKVRHYLEDYQTMIRTELLMTDPLNDLAAKVYKAHREAIDFILENRPDPASEIYPYFQASLVQHGFALGSKNKGYVRFTTPELLQRLPREGQGWPDREPFLMEIDYYWNEQKAVVKAVIAPAPEELQRRILTAGLAARDRSKGWQEPKGRKWLTFYLAKFDFAAEEILKEDPEEIRKRVDEIVQKIAPVATAISNAVLGAFGGDASVQ